MPEVRYEIDHFPNFETHILIAEKNGKRSLINNRFTLFDSMEYVKGGYRSRNVEPTLEERWEDGVKLIRGPWIKIED
jgi:hypothetical protein